MKIIQSNTHQCFVCGVDNPAGLRITFESDGEGKVQARVRFSKQFQGYPGIVHGGVIAAVLDEAAGRATMKSRRPEVTLVTGKLTVRYRKPVIVDDWITVKGNYETYSGRVHTCSSNMISESGEILAEAEVVLVEPAKELVEAITTTDDRWIDQEE
jgi:uncharacterized protein (TIGR00369 family)